MEDVIRALLAGASDQTILEMLERLEKESEIQTEGEDAESRKYESCVTLRGAPILPPVMTEEKRLECLKWRRAALEVEERIGNKRRELLAENIHRIAAGALNRHTNHQVEVEDENDCAPVLHFPAPGNDRLPVTLPQPRNATVGRLNATDADAGDNAKLTYVLFLIKMILHGFV